MGLAAEQKYQIPTKSSIKGRSGNISIRTASCARFYGLHESEEIGGGERKCGFIVDSTCSFLGPFLVLVFGFWFFVPLAGCRPEPWKWQRADPSFPWSVWWSTTHLSLALAHVYPVLNRSPYFGFEMFKDDHGRYFFWVEGHLRVKRKKKEILKTRLGSGSGGTGRVNNARACRRHTGLYTHMVHEPIELTS